MVKFPHTKTGLKKARTYQRNYKKRYGYTPTLYIDETHGKKKYYFVVPKGLTKMIR